MILQRLWKRLKQIVCRHEWIDIIKDNVKLVRFSPEYFETYEGEVCIKCKKVKV